MTTMTTMRPHAPAILCSIAAAAILLLAPAAGAAPAVPQGTPDTVMGASSPVQPAVPEAPAGARSPDSENPPYEGEIDFDTECPPVIGELWPTVPQAIPPPPLEEPYEGGNLLPYPTNLCSLTQLPLAGTRPPAPMVCRDDAPWSPKGLVVPPASYTGLVGTNRLTIEVGSGSLAGSNASKIWLVIGGDHKVGLYGPFLAGHTYEYNFNDGAFWNAIKPDDWDTLWLYTKSKDGLKVKRVKLVLSDQTILDVTINKFLDSHYGRRLYLGVDSAVTKIAQLGSASRVAVLYNAVLDLGQAGYHKYSADPASDGWWCSEFASWALRKVGFDTPHNSIGTGDLETWFVNHDRYRSRAEILAGTYVPKPGDYIAFDWQPDGTCDHSGLFVAWDGAEPTAANPPATTKKFRSIEGNTGNAVKFKTRETNDICFIGDAQ